MHRRKIIALMVFVLVVHTALAQDYLTKGASPDLHLQHTIAPKETWYSLGRMYNLPPAELAGYNKTPISRPLDIGQQVKIPLTAANFSQDGRKGADEVLIPVYHIVQPREWMYRISVNHNKVPIEKLEEWNNISRDDAKAGTRLIVGYLKVKSGNLAQGVSPAPSPTPASRSATTTASGLDRSETAAAAQRQPAGSSSGTATRNDPAVSRQPPSGTPASGPGGYFKSLYSAQGGQHFSGVAGIFKSTSGWQDGKYYALISNVTVGTIIRITYPQTNKSVYAKVLGELPDMKESVGLRIRISDSAAGELGAVNGKFSVDISY